jgi:hypothetical protein
MRARLGRGHGGDENPLCVPAGTVSQIAPCEGAFVFHEEHKCELTCSGLQICSVFHVERQTDFGGWMERLRYGPGRVTCSTWNTTSICKVGSFALIHIKLHIFIELGSFPQMFHVEHLCVFVTTLRLLR